MQVTVHLKGRTECYECRPKPPPKSFPVCTIRNTPDKPIHCVVWAKELLFQRLFGRCCSCATTLCFHTLCQVYRRVAQTPVSKPTLQASESRPIQPWRLANSEPKPRLTPCLID